MTLIDARTVASQSKEIVDLALEDRPECPGCGADSAMQSAVSSNRDGALELVILVCRGCSAAHPAWY